MMKNATRNIIDMFPKLEAYLNNPDAKKINLNNEQQVFLQLAWCFEHHSKFDLNLLYDNLQGDWLEFALKQIENYAKTDMYILHQSNNFLLKEASNLMNQSSFAEYLKEDGLPYNRKKLNVYYKRGKLPDPDVYIDQTPYWQEETARIFSQKEHNRLEKGDAS